MGTAIFLRNSLTEGVDTQVDSLARTAAAESLLDMTVEDGVLVVEPNANAAAVDYFVAVYNPVITEGESNLLTLVGGRGGPEPVVPETLTLEKAQEEELEIFVLHSADGEAEFHAAVAPQVLGATGTLYPQLVAVPLASVNRTIASYIGIYGVLSVLILVAGAFATRFLVTLTFRSLGQVEATAAAIAAGDFSQRMTDIEPTSTEVGRLKTAINAMLNRVDVALAQRDATVRQMRRFIGDASHELRTPLVTVRGYAELYRMGAIHGDQDVAQSMDRIEKEAIRMGLLVEDLLALARLDERRDVVIAPVDLRPVARDAALDLRASAPLRPVTVFDTTAEPPPPAPEPEVADEPQPKRRTPGSGPAVLARSGALSLLRRKPRPVSASSASTGAMPPVAPVPEEPSLQAVVPPVVLGDENKIRQVVTNLLGNARRFTAEDSPIDLRVGVDPRTRMGWIEIVDHGEGVPDQIKDKIFQRFWRADTSRTRETGGTGLGLSIVSSIVDALHGDVRVKDTPGGGATFRVSFPLAATRDAAEHLQLETQPLRGLPLERD
ncbi:putative sensor histidine kinase TcrY [Microbacterium terrae]|uniref:histidine kinase n=1 Tax=Microbacterium terrae TaxID=69369 RepID=A0A0M2HBL0_9MICO|nr:HAMP domain-containing sensor histidine kinase [Microbacterium terrae]KJL42051.1 putative sensor histidine kinase TcrY [Microbacterium terrae]